MQRFKLFDFDAAAEPMRGTYSDYLRETNSFKLPIWLMSMGGAPRLASSYWHFCKSMMLEGDLPMIIEEMAVFLVSVTNGSPYCSSAHAHAVLSLDQRLSFDDLVSLSRDVDSIDLPAATRAALKFAVKVASDPANVSDADLQGLAAHGFSDEQVNELMGVIVLAGAFNTYAISMNLPVEDGYREFPLQQAA